MNHNRRRDVRNSNQHPDRVRNLRQQHDEEYAAEFSSNYIDTSDATSGGVMAGFVGVGASVIALFTMPITMGIAGIILGAFATMKGAKSLGTVAIALGVLTAGAALFYRVALMTLLLSLF